MDKITYLAQLAEGLARWVPERERREILRYYAEYFEEAGEDREAEVVAELGDPWALSSRLAVEGGYVTADQAASWTPKKRKKWPWVLAGVAAAVVVIGVCFASLAASFGMNVARRTVDWVFSDGPMTVVSVEGEDKAMWGEVLEELEGQSVYIANEGTEGFWSMEDGDLNAFYAIDVDVSLGNITVTGGEDFTLFIDQNGGFGGYELNWEIKNGVLKIRDAGAAGQVEISNWDDVKKMFNVGGKAVDVVITVPDDEELEKVSVKTDLGDILLSELDVLAKVEAETSMGNVEGYDVCTANKIDLESSMGDVTFASGELYGGVEIELETSMGNVEVQMDCVESMCGYEAKTSMGNVAVNGVDRGTKVQRKGGDYQLEAKSDMGNVYVYFRDDRW